MHSGHPPQFGHARDLASLSCSRAPSLGASARPRLRRKLGSLCFGTSLPNPLFSENVVSKRHPLVPETSIAELMRKFAQVWKISVTFNVSPYPLIRNDLALLAESVCGGSAALTGNSIAFIPLLHLYPLYCRQSLSVALLMPRGAVLFVWASLEVHLRVFPQPRKFLLVNFRANCH